MNSHHRCSKCGKPGHNSRTCGKNVGFPGRAEPPRLPRPQNSPEPTRVPTRPAAPASDRIAPPDPFPTCGFGDALTEEEAATLWELAKPPQGQQRPNIQNEAYATALVEFWEAYNIPPHIKLAMIRREADRHVLFGLAVNEKIDETTAGYLVEKAGSGRSLLVLRLAQNPYAPPTTLDGLAHHDYPGVRYAVAKNPNTTKNTLLTTLIGDHTRSEGEPTISELAVLHPNMDEPALKELASHPDARIRGRVALNQNLRDVETLTALAYDKVEAVALSVIQNRVLPPGIIEKIAAGCSPVVLKAILGTDNPPPAAFTRARLLLEENAPPLTYNSFLRDTLRKALSNHPHPPANTR